MRLTTAMDRFLIEKREQPCSIHTIRTYKGAIKLFIQHVIHETGNEATLHFTETMVRSFFAHKDAQARDVKRKTLSVYQTALREFARWGVRRRYWSDDPFADIRTIKYVKGLPRPFTAAELDRLMAVPLSGDEEVLRAVLYYGGVREFEACGLRIEDIEPPARAGEVAKLTILGKKQKVRKVSIPPPCWSLVSAQSARRANQDPTPQAPLFAKRDGKPWTPRMVQRRVRAWGRAAEVHDCKPHRFRHTCATDMLEAGEDIRVIQQVLGHSSLDTTAIYTMVTNRRLDAAAMRLRTFDKTSDSH